MNEQCDNQREGSTLLIHIAAGVTLVNFGGGCEQDEHMQLSR
jgi:hypothetical protein